METTREKKNYTPIQNIAYCYKRLLIHCGKKHAFITPFFIIASVGVPVLFTMLPSIVIKALKSNLSPTQLFMYLGGYVVFLCIMQFIVGRLNLMTWREAFEFRLTIGSDFAAKTIGVPYEYLESASGKESLERARAAVYEGTELGVEGIITGAVRFVITVLGFCVFALISATLNPWIMVILIIAPMIRLWLGNKNREWREKAKEEWTPLEVKINYLDKSCLELKNGKDIRIYQIEEWFTQLYNNLLAKRFGIFKQEESRAWCIQFIDRIIGCIRDVICYGYLIYQVFHGMDVETFTLYLGVIAGVADWLFRIADNYSGLLNNNKTINDYRYFMDTKDYWELGGNTPVPIAHTHTITLENVSYTYPGSDVPVFENLNLEISKGEKLAIVGMNGSGKTTLIKVICGLYQPQQGRILLDGIDIKTFNLREYYDRYAVVFQDVFAYAFPMWDNITCGHEKVDQELHVEQCLVAAGLKEKVSTFSKGVHTHMLKDLDEEGINLSGGEMQKLMLARALYKDAKVLILDEPTAALDPIAEAEMYQKYDAFTQGKTSIFISHRLSSTQFCDRVIFLKNGKIIEDGTHDVLIEQQGEYAQMYQLQAHYYQEEVGAHVC